MLLLARPLPVFVILRRKAQVMDVSAVRFNADLTEASNVGNAQAETYDQTKAKWPGQSTSTYPVAGSIAKGTC